MFLQLMSETSLTFIYYLIHFLLSITIDICNQILEVYSDPSLLCNFPDLPQLRLKLHGQTTRYITSSNNLKPSQLEESSLEESASTENKSDEVVKSRRDSHLLNPLPYKSVTSEPYKPLPSNIAQPSPYHPLPQSSSPQSATSPQSSHWSQHSSPQPVHSDASPGYYSHPPSTRYTPDYIPPPPDGTPSGSCPTGDYIPPPPPDSPPRYPVNCLT